MGGREVYLLIQTLPDLPPSCSIIRVRSAPSSLELVLVDQRAVLRFVSGLPPAHLVRFVRVDGDALLRRCDVANDDLRSIAQGDDLDTQRLHRIAFLDVNRGEDGSD